MRALLAALQNPQKRSDEVYVQGHWERGGYLRGEFGSGLREVLAPRRSVVTESLTLGCRCTSLSFEIGYDDQYGLFPCTRIASRSESGAGAGAHRFSFLAGVLLHPTQTPLSRLFSSFSLFSWCLGRRLFSRLWAGKRSREDIPDDHYEHQFTSHRGTVNGNKSQTHSI